MVLKLEYAKQEEIPDEPDVRDSYKEKDGKWVLALPGLKTEADTKKLADSLKKERDEHKATKEKFAPFVEIGDPEEVLGKLARIPELEAAAKGKLDEDAIEKIVTGRVEHKLKATVGPIERSLKKITEERDTLLKTNAEKTEAELRREIRDDLAVALRKTKVVEEAYDDAQLLGERVFTRVDGKTVTKDGVGVTPGLDPEAWLQEIADRKKHWWGPTKGSGATGAGGGLNGLMGAPNPWSHEGWNVTKQGAFLKQHGQEKAAAMAKAVGVDINKPARPAAKK